MKDHDKRNPASKIFFAAIALLFVLAAMFFYTACGGPAAQPSALPSTEDAVQPPAEEQATVKPPAEKPAAVMPRYLTDLYLTRGGDLWITAEAGGVYRLKNAGTGKEKLEDMRTLPGFPNTENCTAVCEDSRGRVWVGTSNMGVQIFNGETWRRYDRDTVLSGSHVHDLASSASGLVAVAHESGVSVYDSQNDTWHDFTVLNGLPSGGVRGVCFGAGDELNCATEIGGYVTMNARGNGRNASRMSAPDTWGADRAVLFPLTATGDGLSSNFCNGIAGDGSGRVCIAGLNGISYGAGRSFRFLQGADLRAKMEGAARKELIADELAAFKPVETPLKESYVNSVCYGKNGLWIGYRTKGFDLRDPENPLTVKSIPNPPRITRPVRAFAELPDGRVVCATYGAGLVELCRMAPFELPSVAEPVASAHPSYKAPDPASLLEDLRRYDFRPDDRGESWAMYFGEDWCTRGDWAGRYGARKQILCAMNTPMSTRSWNGGVSNDQKISNGVSIGPHRNPGDSSRYWVDKAKADDSRDALLQMQYGHRAQAEWNDNGEEYSRTFEGPDLWLLFVPNQDVPCRLSLYFFNSNGRIGDNVERDYIIEIYKSTHGESLNDCMKKKPLCTARVSDFASGGVYKSFVLYDGRGEEVNYQDCLRIRIVRYGSLNVILNGIFVDRLFEEQDMRKIPEEERIAEQGSYRAPRWYDCATDELDGLAGELADRYFFAEESVYGLRAMPVLRLAYYRYIRDNLPSHKTLAERLRWDAAIWTDADRTEFDKAMREYWDELQEKDISRRSSLTCPNSPGVAPFEDWEFELMDKLNIDWRQYRIDATEKPEIPLGTLLEKLRNARMNASSATP